MRKAVSQIFAGNLLSKILGAVREVAVAALFGTGQAIGAYRIAQTGTFVPVNFFTSDALNAAFIPLYKQFKGESNDKAAILLWTLIVLFLVLSALIATALWGLSFVWIAVLAPGLIPVTAKLASTMLGIMALGVPFYLLSSLLTFLSIANADFVPMAVRPSIQNVGLIAGTILAFYWHDALLLGWGFSVSQIVFTVWIGFHTWRRGLLSLPRAWSWPGTKEVSRAFWITLRPMVLLPVILQGSITVERAVATLIGVIAVSALDYARFVSETVLFLISYPVAFVGLSSWSGLDRRRTADQMRMTLALMLLIAVPVSCFLSAHAHAAVQILYARGSFDKGSVQATGDILFGMSLGLWAQVIGYILLKGLNAQMRNRTVLRIMVIGLATNVIVNLALFRYLGPMTLGLGNSVYGLALMVGTVTALGLWREALPTGGLLALGAIGYFVLDAFLPLPKSIWGAFGVAAAFALVYWFGWCGIVPRFRHTLLSAISFNRQRVPS